MSLYLNYSVIEHECNIINRKELNYMSLNMWLPLNTTNGNEILNNGLKDYSFSSINNEQEKII